MILNCVLYYSMRCTWDLANQSAQEPHGLVAWALEQDPEDQLVHRCA